jgi:hypothetical protein
MYEDFALRKKSYKHIEAARILRERDHDGEQVTLTTDALPKKRATSRTGRLTTRRSGLRGIDFSRCCLNFVVDSGEPRCRCVTRRTRRNSWSSSRLRARRASQENDWWPKSSGGSPLDMGRRQRRC